MDRFVARAADDTAISVVSCSGRRGPPLGEGRSEVVLELKIDPSEMARRPIDHYTSRKYFEVLFKTSSKHCRFYLGKEPDGDAKHKSK